MIRILNAEPLNYHDEPRQVLQSLGTVDELQLTRCELIERLPAYDILIVRLGFQVDREVLDAGSTLKAIVTATTGLDHIDIADAARRGIQVLSLRGETDFLRSIPATAEHTWALVLALVRRLPWAFHAVLNGVWNRDAFRGHDVCGRRLGIVGLGRIGQKVAHYGLAFGMQVYAYDPSPTAAMPDVIRCATLTDLLRQSDVLSLHVPLNPSTERLIGGFELALLPTGAVVVNTARGAVLDETALLEALVSGKLLGAALDVLADERTEGSGTSERLRAYARSHDHLLITPHIGGATEESMCNTELFMAEKLKRFLKENLDGRQ
jgi:D-3-phosphoglycerate dehydrogenase